MNFDQIRFANLVNGDFNAVTFSILGMLIVFAGLTIISLYIVVLPKLLELPELLAGLTKTRRKTAAGQDEGGELDMETLLAIAVALHFDQIYSDDNRRITWARHEPQESAWCATGRMNGLALRSQLTRR